MDESEIHETNVHDLSLGVIHALAMVDVKALSYVQLRRLHAAMKHRIDDVSEEAEKRAGSDKAWDTVRLPSPAAKK